MAAKNTTFIAAAATVGQAAPAPPAGFTALPTTTVHAESLSALWLAAYPPEIATDEATAREEIAGMFAGDYGAYWSEASPALFSGNALVAAICTVRRAPWPETPTCPFIVDLMVDHAYRRQGLASFLLAETARVVLAAGAEHIALRVLVDNLAAIRLYRSVGFTDWNGKLHAPEA